MRIGRSSSRPHPRVTIARARSRRTSTSALALDLERRGTWPAVAGVVAPRALIGGRHPRDARNRRSAAPASSAAASTCTYIVSAPFSRAVRLSGVSTATTRPLLMMTTRWQVCDDLGKDVRAEDDRVIAGQAPDEIARLDDLLRIEAGGRLVEDQDFGVVNERLRQADALPVALRQLAAVPIGHVGDVRALHDGGDPLLAFAWRHAL